MRPRRGPDGGPDPNHGAPWWIGAALVVIFGAAMFVSGFAVCQLSC